MTKQKKIVFGTALVIAGLGLITLIDIQTMRLKSNLKEGYMDELGIVVKRMEDMVNNMFRKNNSDKNENRNENNGLKRRDNDKSRDESRNSDTSRDTSRDTRNHDQSRKTDDNSDEGSMSPRVVVLDGDDKDLKNGSGVNKITMLTETDKDKTKGVAVVSANVTNEDKENMNSASKNKKDDKKDDKRPNVTIITTDDKKKDGMSMMIIASDDKKNDDKKKDEVVSTPFSDDKKKEEEKLASDGDKKKEEEKLASDDSKKKDDDKVTLPSSLSLDDDKKKDDEKVTLPSNDSNRSSPMTLGDKNKDVLGSPFSGDKTKKNPLSASDDKKKEEESRSAPLFDDKRNSMSLTSSNDKKKEEEKIISKPSSDDKDKEESKSDDKKNPMSMTIIATDDKKKDDDKDKKNPLSMMIIATDNKGTNSSADKKKDDKEGAMNLTIITAEGSTSPEADKRKRSATLDDDKKKKDEDLLPLASDSPAFGSLEMLNYDMNSILSGDKDKKEKEIKITPGTSDSNKDDDKKKNELTNDKSKSTSDGDYEDEGRGKKLRESKQSSSDENKKMASKALFGKSDDHENKDENNKNDSGYSQNTNIYIMPQKDKEEKKPILIVPIKESKAAATPYQVNSTLSTPQNKPKHRSKLVVMQRTITQTVRPLSKDKEEKKKKTEIKNDKKQWKKNGEKESKMPKLFNSLQSQPTVRLSARRESENGSYDRKARDESDLDSSVEMENSSISSIDNEDYSKKERSLFGNKSKNSQNKNKQRSIDNENKKRSSNDKDQSGMFVKNLTIDDGKDEDHLNDKYLSNYGFGNNPADFFDKTFQSDYKNDSSKKAPLTVGDTKRKSSDNEGISSPSSGDDKNKNMFSGRSIDLLSDDYKNSNQRSTKPSVNLDDNDEKDKDAFRRKSLDMFTDGGSNETGVRSFTPFSDFSKVTTPINSSFSTLSNDDDDKKKSPFDSSASLYNFNDKVNDQAYGGQSIDDLLQNFDKTFGQPDEDKMGTNELFNILEEGKRKSEDDKPHGKQPVLKSSLTKSLEDSDEMKFPHHNPTNLERTYIDPFNLQTKKLIEQNLNPGEMDVRGANLNVTDDKQNLN